MKGELRSLRGKPLSPTLLRIPPLLAQGMSNKEIGDALFLSEGTVKMYIHRILVCLHLKRRVQIGLWWRHRKPAAAADALRFWL